MAIQNRRGNYADFDPAKMKPGEFAVVQTGDPNGDGAAVYMAFAAGKAKRLATLDELKSYDNDARVAAEAAESAKKDAQHALEESHKWKQAVDKKAADLLALTTDADQVAKQALEKAGNAENEAAETANQMETLNRRIDSMILDLQNYVNDGYVENGVGKFLHGESVLFEMSGIGGGGGGGGGSDTNKAVITVTNTTGWLSKTIPSGAACPISLTWSSVEDEMPTGNGTVRITVNGSVRATLEVAQGQIELDLSKYVSTGSNVARVQVSDIYGNARTINFSVTVTLLALSSTFDTATTYQGAILFPYTPVGSILKTVHFILDGREIGTQQTSVSGRQMSYTIPAQSHGAHSIRCYFEAEINGDTVRSNELYYEFIAVEPLNDDVIITSSFSDFTQSQYSSIPISFTVYDPSSDMAEVRIYANDELVSTQTVDRTEQSYTYRANVAGPLKIDIKSGRTTKTLNFTITESAVDVEAETQNLALHMTSQGRSNNEEHPEVWASDVGDITANLTGFNWASDGWQIDDEGIVCLRVSGSARVEIPYQPFAHDARRDGLTIEIEYATRNVSDYNATILSCMNGGRGLKITPQQASLKSEQTELTMQYKENEHIRVAYTIDKRSQNRLVMTFIDGMIARVAQYPEDDDFSQVTPAGISIGSDDCTIDIYCIRVYTNNLTMQQVLENWIADTQNGPTMLARYTRNQILDAYGQVVFGALPPNLPYMIIEGPELPQYKGDKKTVSITYVDKLYPSNSFTATGVQANVQGTSSAPYYVKNEDLQFKNGFEMNTSGHSGTYKLRSASMPAARFVIKADVASSESANNVELVDLYNALCPYKTPEMQADSRVRWGIEGIPIVVFWHNTDTGITTFVGKFNFNFPKRFPEGYGYTGDQESWEWQNNTSDRMLFKSDDFDEMYTDPETLDVYPAWKNDYEARFPEDTWEDIDKLKEWISWVVSTDRDHATGNTLDTPIKYGDITYTRDTAEYRLAKFDAEIEDYAEIRSLIFYYIFTEFFLLMDSRAKNLFMGFHGSPCEIEGSAIDRKVVAEPYDMDTAMGTNNEGTLSYGYSLEDTDTIAGADVFNGQHSTLWCNLRDTRRAAIVSMYQTLRSTGGLNYTNIEKKYEARQDTWPEAIWNEDAQKKYIEPLVSPAAGKEATDFYLPMCQGSKEQQRKWWLANRFAYMDSKWNAGDALAQVIQLRGYAKADITVTPYIDLYTTVKYGSYLVQQRGQAGVPATLVCPMDSVNDTEIYIYSAPQIASAGDLSGLKVGVADFSAATRIQEVKVGDASPTYDNPNMKRLSFGSNVLLRKVDARNCSALGSDEQKSVDLSNCPIIEEVYFEGTVIQGLVLPNGGVLKKLHVPATLTNLTIRNQKNLTEFIIPSFANISTLRLENNGSALDTLGILRQIPASTRVRLVGFTWEAENAAEIESILDLLDTMRGLDENGNNVDTAQVSGTIHTATLTGAQITSYNARYPYLRISADHTTSYRTYANYDGTVLKKVECIDGVPQEGAPSNPSRSQTAQYTFAFVGWSKKMDAEVADSDALDNVIADRTIYAAYSKTVRTYTVTWKDSNGTVLETDTNVPYGTTPTYNGATPHYNGQTFTQWNPKVSPVTGNVTYTASYTPIYTVYFYNGTVLLKEEQVMKGGSATPPSETPVSPDGSEYEFTGWQPGYTNIQGDTSCYAQYKEPFVVEEITDDWATIISKIANGTAAYKLGNYKPLDLGSEGIVNMQIIGRKASPLASGSGTATYDWLSMEPLKTDHRMNPTLEYGTKQAASWTGANNVWTSQNRYAVSTAKATWSITATESGTLTIAYKTSNANASRNKITKLTVNGTDVVTNYSNTTGSSYNVEVGAGDIVTVYCEYDLLNASYNYYATITLSGTGAFTVASEIENAETRDSNHLISGTGAVGAPDTTEMYSYLQNTIKPLIPSVVRGALKTVKKYTTMYNTSGQAEKNIETSMDVWIPSYREMNFSGSSYETMGPKYDSAFPDNASRIKKKVGASSASWWWLRSAISSNYFFNVYSSGNYNSYGAYNSYPLALGFSL